MKGKTFYRSLTVALLAMLTGEAFAQTEVPAPQNVYARQSISLNGDWNYFADVQEQGYYDYRMKPTQWGYFQNAKPQKPSDLIEYDFDACPTMHIPGDWNTQDEQLFLYEGTVWLKRDFDYTPSAGQRALLYFGAVNYETIVYVNGKKAGRHVGGFTPFCFDVTDLVKEGKNFVIVKVDNKRHQDNVPTRNFDWWNYGGITRDVLLVTVGDTYIDDYTLQLDKTVLGKKRMLNFSLSLNRPEAGQEITLSIPELKLKQKFVTDSEGQINSQLSTLNSQLKLWSPENPKLYQVEIARGDEIIKDEIGFRTIETRGRQLLLNGKQIFLRGVCSHEETAYTSRRCRRCRYSSRLGAAAGLQLPASGSLSPQRACRAGGRTPGIPAVVGDSCLLDHLMAECRYLCQCRTATVRYDTPRPQPRCHHHLVAGQRDAPQRCP